MITRTKHSLHSGIYQIKSTINGKIYIGSAVFITRRKHEHFGDLKKGKHLNKYLQRHYIKYGAEDLQFTVLERCVKEKLIEREQYYIDTLNPDFNMCKKANSVLGLKHSEESKQKNREFAIKRMSDPLQRQKVREAALKQFSDPEQRKKISDSAKERYKTIKPFMFGKHHTEEVKKKISEARKGKLPWNKGIPRTIEEKIKISLSHIGLHKGDKNPMFGKKHSQETKEKSSKNIKAWYQTPEGMLCREKMSTDNRMCTLEMRQYNREKSIQLWKNPDIREKLSGKNHYMYGKHLSPELIQKQNAGRKKTRLKKLLNK